MSRRASIIADAFACGSGGHLDKYRGRELDFYTERGRLYPEKLEEVFSTIFGVKCSDLVVVGPRGGGKTMGVSDAVLALFLFKEFDAFQIGGSLEQANKGFNYVRQILYQDTKLSESLQDELKTMATGARGNWYKVAPSSMKQVRGPHPGDPHPEMDWEPHGGVLVKDERDEMDDDIADAADFCLDSADPSINITTSTMHRDDGGGIALMADEAEARGAKVIKFDVFDVCEVCTHDCAVCPGGQAFAGALFGGVKAKNKIGTLPSAASFDQWDQWQKDNAWPEGEAPYCEGRAKQHRPGHYKMHKIFSAYKRSRNIEIFEVELCCRKRRGARKVVDASRLDGCLAEDVFYQAGYDDPIVTIDWGLKGWCVLHLVQGQMDNTIAVVESEYLHMASSDSVWDLVEDWQRDYGCYEVFADASHPYENLKGVERGFRVTEVAFNAHKEMGAGWIKGIIERGQLRIRGKIERALSGTGEVRPDFIFWSDGARELHRQLKAWRRDKHGKIVKADDHGCDSLLCAALKFADQQPWEVNISGTGTRESRSL